MTITVVFDPPLPSDSPATFNTKAFATLGGLNDWSTEANALAADVTAKQGTASTAATTATTQAGIATTGAGTATTQAGIATAAAASINAIEATIHAATSKATPVDADEFGGTNSAASFGLVKFTWANIKATLKTYLDTLYQAVGTYVTPTTLNNGTLPASVTTLAASGNVTLGDAEATDTHTVKGATTVLANSASPAVKITQTGSGNAFTVEDVASDTTPFVIDGGGRVILGSSTVITGSQLETHGVTDAFRFSLDAVGQSLRFFKSRGTAAAPWTTAVASGDNIASFDYYGADGAGPILAARITASVDGTPGTNDMPGRLVFSTTADGASSPTERMRIDSSGNVLVTNPAGLGYGTGAGGTVTQATSKTTTVVLHKPCGQITMNNAALGAGGTVSFQLTNSLIAATDLVLAMSIGTFSSYRVDTFPFAGGVVMRVTNFTGGSLSEAAVISFAVIKGAAS